MMFLDVWHYASFDTAFSNTQITQLCKTKYVQRNTEARSRNHCCRGKAISITHDECVRSFSYSAKRMRRVILSSAAYQAIPVFF